MRLELWVQQAAVPRTDPLGRFASLSSTVFYSRMCSEGFSFISWGSGGWRCARWSWLERPQPFATVRNRPQPFATVRRLALSLGEALAGDFLWIEKVSLCAAILLWFAWKWYVTQERWCISLHRRRVLWKWHVCVVVILGIAVSEWWFGGVESRCSIGICSCKVAWKAPFLWQVSGKTSILQSVCESRSSQNHSKR